mmetsp:Transcript_2366/g.2840  ORF Transcript_2366/g.2840 Transcript_2366/m.2840 type:complete len:294 (-) Transcript_2366:75-956(-)
MTNNFTTKPFNPWRCLTLIISILSVTNAFIPTKLICFKTKNNDISLNDLRYNYHLNYRYSNENDEKDLEIEDESDSKSVNISFKAETNKDALSNNIDKSLVTRSLMDIDMEQSENQSSLKKNILQWLKDLQIENTKKERLNEMPPFLIEDTSVLYYDIFLILNLSVSISFWVVHRLSLFNILESFCEGSLLSILWIASGLYNGSFLYSAIDGHYDTSKEEDANKGGPKTAGLLGLWTFVGAMNMRIVIALVTACLEHRPVGVENGEELIPLELCFGLILMSMWRMLHSSYSRV